MSAGVCNPHEYMDAGAFKRIQDLAESVETPALIIDTSIVGQAYDSYKAAFKNTNIFYAVKACPSREVCQVLFDRGSSFDVASTNELRDILSLEGMKEEIVACGGIAERISFGNTIKKVSDILFAYEAGVRLFATDSEGDIRHLATAAPGAKIFVRVLTETSSCADWPLSRKFGCHPDMAMDLLILARELGLKPHGISFHVGSQQRDIAAWDSMITKSKVIFERLRDEDGIVLQLLNIGGGFPANYLQRTHGLEVYAAEILRFLGENFNDQMPQIMIEPGRGMVGNAGVLVSEIVMVSRKSRFAIDRWVYLDAGVLNGLIETIGENLKYPIWTPRTSKTFKAAEEEVIIAGPTCDSMDIMYEKFKYKLPLNLCSGDKLYFLSAGAYTASYASVYFNGYTPVKTYFV